MHFEMTLSSFLSPYSALVNDDTLLCDAIDDQEIYHFFFQDVDGEIHGQESLVGGDADAEGDLISFWNNPPDVPPVLGSTSTSFFAAPTSTSTEEDHRGSATITVPPSIKWSPSDVPNPRRHTSLAMATSLSIISDSSSVVSADTSEMVTQECPLPPPPRYTTKKRDSAVISPTTTASSSKSTTSSSRPTKKRRTTNLSTKKTKEIVADSSKMIFKMGSTLLEDSSPEAMEQTRARNRHHARSSRNRKKMLTTSLQECLKELKAENEKLRTHITERLGSEKTNSCIDERRAAPAVDQFISDIKKVENRVVSGSTLDFLQSLKKDALSMQKTREDHAALRATSALTPKEEALSSQSFMGVVG